MSEPMQRRITTTTTRAHAQTEETMSSGKWKNGLLQDSLLGLMNATDPKSAHELAELIGASLHHTRTIIRKLHEAQSVRIADWRYVDKCHITPLFVAGAGKDTPKPSRKSKAERNRIYRQRKKEEGLEALERRFENDRAAKAREALAQPAFRHWQDAALFGEYARAA